MFFGFMLVFWKRDFLSLGFYDVLVFFCLVFVEILRSSVKIRCGKKVFS